MIIPFRWVIFLWMMAALSTFQIVVILISLILLAGGLTCLVKRLAIIDQPNHRSSHARPMPKSGGMAIVVTTYAGVGLLLWLQNFSSTALPLLVGLGIGAALLSLAGLLDDLGRLNSFKSKLAWQFLGCCVLFPFGLVLETLPLPFWGEISLGWLGYPVTVLWVLALTNIFNFMDGLDGLAAGTATVVAFLVVVLGGGGASGVSGAICFVLFAATLGFLVFNFPRAQIFLGDVGSQFLGFVFAIVAVLAAVPDHAVLPVLVVPLLFFHFIFDTLFTFCRRLLAQENVTQAHRSHLYQLLNQSGLSHARVSIIHIAITLAQGGGAYVMLQLSASLQWVVFLPYLAFQIAYAVFVMNMARRRRVLD